MRSIQGSRAVPSEYGFRNVRKSLSCAETNFSELGSPGGPNLRWPCVSMLHYSRACRGPHKANVYELRKSQIQVVSLHVCFRLIASVRWTKLIPFTLEVKVPPSARRPPPLAAGCRPPALARGAHGLHGPQSGTFTLKTNWFAVRLPAVRPPSGPWPDPESGHIHFWCRNTAGVSSSEKAIRSLLILCRPWAKPYEIWQMRITQASRDHPSEHGLQTDWKWWYPTWLSQSVLQFVKMA